MTKRSLPTPEQLRQLLRYEPETGKLYWKVRDRKWFKSSQAFSAWNTKYPGNPAMSTINNHGYMHGTLFGRSYLAHRVAWAIYHGEWPDSEVDHINRNRADNRALNMRPASESQNQHNRAKSSNNTSGYKGVVFDKRWGKWYARIGMGGKIYNLGTFSTPESAHAAYCEAANKYHCEFARVE